MYGVYMYIVPMAVALSISYLVSYKKRVENADRNKREKQLHMKPTADLDRDE